MNYPSIQADFKIASFLVSEEWINRQIKKVA